MATTPAANEAALLEAFLPVRDPHERLALITEACTGPGVPEDLRQDADLVTGCVSQVWLCGTVSEGMIQLRWDAASSLVRGLAGLICIVYQHTAVIGIRDHRSAILTQLSLDRQLSPTRLRGLAAIEARIHGLAAVTAKTWRQI